MSEARSRAPRSVVRIVALASACTGLGTAACSEAMPLDVSSEVAVIEVGAGETRVPVDGQIQLTVTARDVDGAELSGGEVAWAVDDESVATIDAGGRLSGVGLGEVTAIAAVGEVFGSLEITVSGFLIGPNGGMAHSADGHASLLVPPGGVSEDVVFTIDSADPSDLPAGVASAGLVPGSSYRFGPEGLSVTGDLDIRIRYEPASIPPYVEEGTVRLRRVSAGEWGSVVGSATDMEDPAVLGAVTELGVYGALGAVVNQAPSVAIGSPANGASFLFGTSITFQGVGTDPEDGTLSGGDLAWTSDLDGQFGSGDSITTIGLSIGAHVIVLRGTDSLGGSGVDQVSIDVLNNDPTAAISAPADGSVHVGALGLTFVGEGTDVEDGTLTGGSLVWTSSLDGQIGSGETFATSALSLGAHTITLTVTDSHGGMDTAQIAITVI